MRAGPNLMTGALVKRKQTHGEKAGAETGLTHLQAKECQGCQQKPGERHGTVSPSEPPKEPAPSTPSF